MSNAGGEPIVNAIYELRPGEWDAKEGEVLYAVLVMKPATRPRHCCDDDLYCVAEATRGSFSWGLWRCRHCERSYSIGPKLPHAWVGRLAEICIDLYTDYQAAVAEAYRLKM